ncbi:glycosyltransferase [Motilibacter aurantiacus]|uniref:glycosyltransferase n=1 Tax=Motilibacter aurantiacus TaxID=2714955 RepID=UPI001408CA09|nr:glycosyltransferase [Motilibacter aurantiacus]NHC44739.1 hypothetical protein [Motilibacter aurantiacus]
MQPEVSLVAGCDPYAVPLRVLHVAYADVAPVVPGFVAAAARQQADRGWDVHVATERADAAGVATSHVLEGASRRPSAVRRAARRLHGVVAAVDPEVLVLHGRTAGVVGRYAVRGRVPTAYLPHGALPAPWSGLGLPTAWERVASPWTSLVVLQAAEVRALRGRVSTAPQFVLGALPGEQRDPEVLLERLAGILSRAHVFGWPAQHWTADTWMAARSARALGSAARLPAAADGAPGAGGPSRP